MPWSALDLYQSEYKDKQFERLDLLTALVARYDVARALYPGSYCHVTPSFVIPEMVYVDSDHRALRFFADPAVKALAAARKAYDSEPVIRFHAQDYAQALPEPEESFDLLISQWAGPVSVHCGRYLRPGGLLLANNSHADAGLASLDSAYTLVATVQARGGRYHLSEAELEGYFTPKRGASPIREALLASGRGVAYTRTASMYLFRKR